MSGKYVPGGISKLFSPKKTCKIDTSLFVTPPQCEFEGESPVVPEKPSKKRKKSNVETREEILSIPSEPQPTLLKKMKVKKPRVSFKQPVLEDKDEHEGPIKKAKRPKKTEYSIDQGNLDEQPILPFIEKPVDDPEKIARTLFIGNLPTTYGKKQIKSLFSKYGKAESVRIRNAVPGKPNMTKKIAVITKTFHPDRESINAYVVLKTREKAHEALELNGLAIEGNHIRVDWADNKDHDHSRSIFVGNLPFGLQDDELRTFFNDCGKVESIRIVRDKATGAGKGFGYVLFQSQDCVALALKKHEEELAGRNIRVFRARKEKVKHPGRKACQLDGLESYSRDKVMRPKWLTNNSGGNRSFEGVRSVEDVKERVKIQRNIKTSAIKSQKMFNVNSKVPKKKKSKK